MLELTVVDNFLSAEECQTWIDFHKEHFPTVGEQHGGTNIVDLQDTFQTLYAKKERHDVFRAIKYLNARLNAYIQSIDPQAFLNYNQLVEWPPESSQPNHLDLPFHTYTSIIYLNDDFTGGETRVKDINVIPKTGKMITFSGNSIYHQVQQINTGTRYTIPVWYLNL